MSEGNEFVAAALAALSDQELQLMHKTILLLPRVVPDVLEWMDEAATWETERRMGERSPLRSLRDAIAAKNFEAALAFVSSSAQIFRNDTRPEARAVAQLFSAMNATLHSA